MSLLTDLFSGDMYIGGIPTVKTFPASKKLSPPEQAKNKIRAHKQD